MSAPVELQITPILQDLKLTILSSAMLYPSKPTENRSVFLSDVDQSFNFNVETAHFFSANPQFSAMAVAERLQSAIERVLVTYDFLAGRLRINKREQGRLEIECNAAGVGFAVAVSELNLEEIGELDYPHPAFQELVVAALQKLGEGLKMEERPLCSFQLTFFRCGGFVLGLSSNHITMDGISARTFLDNIAALASGHTLAATPFTDRHLLTARSPPCICFHHPQIINPTDLPPFHTDLDLKLFRLDAAMIAKLKSKAQLASCNPTCFKVVAAHLWRCKSQADSVEPSSTSMLSYIIDIRAKLQPPLPKEYFGNAVLSSYATAKAGELAGLPFWRVVELVSEAEARMNDEYARSLIDCMFVRRGILCPQGLVISSWLWLGFADVEYPWGRPAYVYPLVRPFCEMIILLPSLGGPEKGANVLVVLRREVMERFTSLFYKFMSDEQMDKV